MPAKRKLAMLMGATALLGAGHAAAGIVVPLLDENFQDVTGISTASTVRTVASILTDVPMPLDGSPVASFSNVGNGNASASSFNVRRWDNALDGSGPAAVGDVEFDNFFGASPNQFLVIGDDSGNMGGTPNGGTSTGASSTLEIRFALAPVNLADPHKLSILFDYVFDANNTANPDDFIAELILADASTVNLLNLGAPTAATRGSFNTFIPYSTLSAAPTALNFRLIEGEDNGSSAAGLDNLKVNLIPEPGMLALLGLGLAALGLVRGRQC